MNARRAPTPHNSGASGAVGGDTDPVDAVPGDPVTDTVAHRGTPRERRLRARRQQIMDVALQIAQHEGWSAVTTRRVADAIDYSQPVIYQHFRSRDDLIDAIARSGFVMLRMLTDELADRRGQASGAATEPDRGHLEDLCRLYLHFGAENPRLYQAMFSRPTALQFATTETPAELRESFASIRRVVAPHVGEVGADEAAELLWAACHGLVSLRAAGRIPPDRIEAHIARIPRLWG